MTLQFLTSLLFKSQNQNQEQQQIIFSGFPSSYPNKSQKQNQQQQQWWENDAKLLYLPKYQHSIPYEIVQQIFSYIPAFPYFFTLQLVSQQFADLIYKLSPSVKELCFVDRNDYLEDNIYFPTRFDSRYIWKCFPNVVKILLSKDQYHHCDFGENVKYVYLNSQVKNLQELEYLVEMGFSLSKIEFTSEFYQNDNSINFLLQTYNKQSQNGHNPVIITEQKCRDIEILDVKHLMALPKNAFSPGMLLEAIKSKLSYLFHKREVINDVSFSSDSSDNSDSSDSSDISYGSDSSDYDSKKADRYLQNLCQRVNLLCNALTMFEKSELNTMLSILCQKFYKREHRTTVIKPYLKLFKALIKKGAAWEPVLENLVTCSKKISQWEEETKGPYISYTTTKVPITKLFAKENSKINKAFFLTLLFSHWEQSSFDLSALVNLMFPNKEELNDLLTLPVPPNNFSPIMFLIEVLKRKAKKAKKAKTEIKKIFDGFVARSVRKNLTQGQKGVDLLYYLMQSKNACQTKKEWKACLKLFGLTKTLSSYKHKDEHLGSLNVVQTILKTKQTILLSVIQDKDIPITTIENWKTALYFINNPYPGSVVVDVVKTGFEPPHLFYKQVSTLETVLALLALKRIQETPPLDLKKFLEDNRMNDQQRWELIFQSITVKYPVRTSFEKSFEKEDITDDFADGISFNFLDIWDTEMHKMNNIDKICQNERKTTLMNLFCERNLDEVANCFIFGQYEGDLGKDLPKEFINLVKQWSDSSDGWQDGKNTLFVSRVKGWLEQENNNKKRKNEFESKKAKKK